MGKSAVVVLYVLAMVVVVVAVDVLFFRNQSRTRLTELRSQVTATGWLPPQWVRASAWFTSAAGRGQAGGLGVGFDQPRDGPDLNCRRIVRLIPAMSLLPSAPMRLRPATEEEIRDWDAAVLRNPDRGDLLQSTFFAEQKRRNGWTPRYMVYDGPHPIHTLYLVKAARPLGEVWYAPKGPGLSEPSDLAAVVAANAAYVREHPGILLFKLEPELPADTSLPPTLVRTTAIQPNVHTIIVDLRPDEDEIFASFRQRGRRSVRKAEKQGITVEHRPATAETMRVMYALYQETAERGGFHLREYPYYEQFWSGAARAGLGSFHFAIKDDQPVAGIFVTHFGTKGLYKDGASSRAIGNSGAPYLLQWEVMKHLKAHGVTAYDLHTTPPPEAMEDKDHPSYGLGQFKSGFSNEIVSYVGTLDQPVRARAYRIWQRAGERLALTLSYRVRHRLYY